MKIPEDVRWIIGQLNSQGYEACAVGGCVRDMLLGREPEDWDITTSARPEQVKAVFRRTVDTGIAHGTVTVLRGKQGYEVTTYRIDGVYTDGRHPEQVTFTPSLEEDLKRRDFTINAMAYNERDGITDLFGGREDLAQGVIRCVGNPLHRFGEDALRMMRAVRFAAQLGFAIEESTLSAIRELAPTIRKISAERVRTELVKLLVSPHPEQMRLLYETGLTAYILPEFDRMMETAQNTPYHSYSVGNHTLAVLENVPPIPALRVAALLHDVGKPDCRKTDQNGRDHFFGHAGKGAELAKVILKRLKFDNETLRAAEKLIRHHSDAIEPTGKQARRMLHRVGEDIFPLLLLLMEGDNMGKTPEGTNERLERLRQVHQIYQEILKRQDCVSLKTLELTGDDLLAEGIPKGKQIGELLQYCLELVIEEPEKNRHEFLIAAAMKKYEEIGSCQKSAETGTDREN